MSEIEILSLILFTALLVIVPAWQSYYFFPKLTSPAYQGPKQRLDFYDFLRGLAIVAVIVIHVTYVYAGTEAFEANRFFLTISNNLARFCIPIFFICSGLLLRPWSETSDKVSYFQSKFLRIFLPYIIIVSLIAVYRNYSLEHFYYDLINGTALVPYYFIIVLLQLYLLYPLLSKYRKNKLLLPVTFSISLMSATVFSPTTIFDIVLFVRFVFFFAYGIYLRDYFLGEAKLSRPQVIMWLVILGLYLLNITIFPAIFYNTRFFYGLAVFNLLYHYRNNISKYAKIFYQPLRKIGTYSLWIFLIHYMIEELIFNLTITWPINIYFHFSLIVAITLFFSYYLSVLLAWVYAKLLRAFDLKTNL